MTETNSLSEPPKGWRELLAMVYQDGQGLYGWTIPPEPKSFRQHLKHLTFWVNYSQKGPTPQIKWALSLSLEGLNHAVRQACGLDEYDPSKFTGLEYNNEGLRELAERLNEGITRDNVHTIEKLGDAGEQIRRATEGWDGADFSKRLYTRVGIKPPARYDGLGPVYDPPVTEPKPVFDDPFEGRPRVFSMQAVLGAISGGDTALAAQDENRCLKPPVGCGGPKGVFNDPASAAEYRITALCQACQDANRFFQQPEYECPGHAGSNPEEPDFCDGSCLEEGK